MKSFPTLLSSALLSVFLSPFLHAAGCCEGFGGMGLEGEWHSADSGKGPKSVEISNASIETSRELFSELNKDFSLRWLHRTGYTLTIRESHGSTEAQARAIIQGADPDFVSLDNPGAIDAIAANGKLAADWQGRLPHNSSPYTTTVVFVVDKGNPKHIKNWADLAAPGVAVITPNPKTSGRGQWNYLAAWSQALRSSGSAEKAQQYVGSLYHNVPVLNSSGRGAQETFFKKHVGDVLLVWESDARKLLAENPSRKIEIVTPSSSILVELPVAYVDSSTQKHGTARVTVSFAQYLFTEAAQEVIAKNFFRPRDITVAAKFAKEFPEITLLNVDDSFGSWANAYQQHFVPGGLFDRVSALENPAPANATTSAHN